MCAVEEAACWRVKCVEVALVRVAAPVRARVRECTCACAPAQTCTASRRLVGMVEERRSSQAVGFYGGYCRLCEISTVSQMRYFLGLIPSTGSGKLNLVLESLLLDLGILVANRSIQVPDLFETHS